LASIGATGGITGSSIDPCSHDASLARPGIHCAAFRSNTPDGYTDRVPKPENLAQAGLVGWRKAIADSVAPRAASRAPVSEERLRAAIGAAFFLLSLYYVATTIARMIKSAQS
jgi:hypothetical protein